TTIEVKISGIRIILSRPIKMLLAMLIAYRLILKNGISGNKVSKNPNPTPKTAAIKICVFKLIFTCIFNIDLKPHYATQELENRVIFYKHLSLEKHQAGSGVRLDVGLYTDLLGFNFS